MSLRTLDSGIRRWQIAFTTLLLLTFFSLGVVGANARPIAKNSVPASVVRGQALNVSGSLSGFRGTLRLVLQQRSHGRWVVRDSSSPLHRAGKFRLSWTVTTAASRVTMRVLVRQGTKTVYAFPIFRTRVKAPAKTVAPTQIDEPAPEISTTPTVANAIKGVTAEQLTSTVFRLTWINPSDATIGGWIISHYPESGSGRMSGAPYPDPELSTIDIDTGAFSPEFRFSVGQQWRICIEPIEKGLDSNGNYKPMTARTGCAPTITWR